MTLFQAGQRDPQPPPMVSPGPWGVAPSPLSTLCPVRLCQNPCYTCSSLSLWWCCHSPQPTLSASDSKSTPLFHCAHCPTPYVSIAIWIPAFLWITHHSQCVWWCHIEMHHYVFVPVLSVGCLRVHCEHCDYCEWDVGCLFLFTAHVAARVCLPGDGVAKLVVRDWYTSAKY